MPKWLVLHLLEPSKLPVPVLDPTESILPDPGCPFFVLMNLFDFFVVESIGLGMSCYFWSFFRLVSFLKVAYSSRSILSIEFLTIGDADPAPSRIYENSLRFSFVALGLPKVSKLQSRAKLLLECWTVLCAWVNKLLILLWYSATAYPHSAEDPSFVVAE